MTVVVFTRRDGGRGSTFRRKADVTGKIVAAWKPGMSASQVAEITDEDVSQVSKSLSSAGIIPAKANRGGWREGAGRKAGGR